MIHIYLRTLCKSSFRKGIRLAVINQGKLWTLWSDCCRVSIHATAIDFQCSIRIFCSQPAMWACLVAGLGGCTYLVGAHGDGLLEQQPHDALLARRCGEGAAVGPVITAGGEEAGRVKVREGCLLALERGGQVGSGHMHAAHPGSHPLWERTSNARENRTLERGACLSEIKGGGRGKLVCMLQLWHSHCNILFLINCR